MRVLFVQKRPCFPTNNGAQIRTSQVVRYLARKHSLLYLSNVNGDGTEKHGAELMRSLGIDAEFVPWSEPRRTSVRFYLQLLRSYLTPYPFNAFKDFNRELARLITARVSSGNFDLLVCDFTQTALNVLQASGIPKLLFTHNVESEIFYRLSDASRNVMTKWLFRSQAYRMERFERELATQFDGMVAVSQRDRDVFVEKFGWKNVYVIDTGVDTEYFRPQGLPAVPGRIVFVGGLDWLPNIEGVTEFVEKCWPRIRTARPDATFDIVGRNPHPRLRRLANTPGVNLVGTVPDVRPYWESAEVAVVLLRAGGGTRLKIPEALAMERAVVTTSLGMEGLPLLPGEHLLVADDPSEFADAVLRLLNNPQLRHQIARQGAEWVRNRFAADTVGRQFASICQDLVSRITPRDTLTIPGH